MKRQFRAVIVDNERLSRDALKILLAEHPEIQVVGEANNVQKAIEVVENLKPDVVFLDIQMPGEPGFELLNKVEVTFEVIFVTAFDEYAIRAFDVNALDYLLKPVHPNRLADAIKRLFDNESAPKKGTRKLEYDDRIFLNLDNKAIFLKINTIKCIRAEGNYSEILTSDSKKSLVLMSLVEWEERLPEKYFIRIHRSIIVNTEYVDRMDKWYNYSYRVYLRDLKEPLAMSRRYAAKLKAELK